MGNIISILQEIFMLKEDNSSKVGLSYLKERAEQTQPSTARSHQPKELRLSELMRRSSY